MHCSVEVSPSRLDRGTDILKQSADLPWDFRPLHRCRNRAAGSVPQDVQGFHAQNGGRKLQTSDIFARGNVPRNPRDKQVSEPLIEDDFDGNTGVSAT